MITTAIPGRPLEYRMDAAATRAALIAAGRDLAVINGIAVEGFGWIRRDGAVVKRLAAEHATNRAFVYESLNADLALLREHGFTTGEITTIEAIIERYESWIDIPRACLAHGDFDVTHIFQEGGRYTGIIDFGEIRGADWLYDLGHFRMHDGETVPTEALPYLLEGYGQMAPLPVDVAKRLPLLSLLIAIRALGRFLRKHPGERTQRHIGYAAIRREMAALSE
jgi:Ser/Thr protein kinase RdoA (MazF antagonist)